MENLKPCPFCGECVAEISNLQECEECANFEQEECPVCYEPVAIEIDAEHHPCPRFIVCNVNKGGCGASTGWHYNLEELIKAWNKRANDDRAL